jgi:hypothetical protein
VSEPIFMKLGMYIMAPEPLSTAYFINLSYQSVCLDVNPDTVVRQRLGKNVTPSMSTHVTIEFLDTSLSVPSVSCPRKVED